VPAQVTAEVAVELVGGLSRALSSWRGVPFIELGDASPVDAERTRQEELRLVAIRRSRIRALKNPVRFSGSTAGDVHAARPATTRLAALTLESDLLLCTK
jgi:hypothetical protein